MTTRASRALSSDEKKQIHLRITPDNKTWLDDEVRKRGVAMSDIVDQAIAQYSSEEVAPTHDMQWLMTVVQLQEQVVRDQHMLIGHIGILLEAVGMLARVYLTCSAEIREEDKQLAERRGTRRYRNYIEAIAARLRARQNLVTDLPEDIFKPEEKEA